MLAGAQRTMPLAFIAPKTDTSGTFDARDTFDTRNQDIDLDHMSDHHHESHHDNVSVACRVPRTKANRTAEGRYPRQRHVKSMHRNMTSRSAQPSRAEVDRQGNLCTYIPNPELFRVPCFLFSHSMTDSMQYKATTHGCDGGTPSNERLSREL